MPLIRRCRCSSLSTCTQNSASGGPCTLPCARGAPHVPQSLASQHQYPVPAQTKLQQYSMSRSGGLSMDQQSNLRSFTLWLSIKQPNRFEEDFIIYHFLHSSFTPTNHLHWWFVGSKKKSPSSSSSPIVRALRWLESRKINFSSHSGRYILERDKKQRRFSPYICFSLLHDVTRTKPTKILMRLSSGLQCQCSSCKQPLFLYSPSAFFPPTKNAF